MDDGTPHLATHKVLDVLGNSGEAEVVFTGALCQAKEEIGTVFVFHELPSFVDEKETTLLFGTDDIPDVGEDDVHSDGAEFVFEVADVEDNHLVIDVDIGLLREDAGESTGSVFSEAVGELGAGASHME